MSREDPNADLRKAWAQGLWVLRVVGVLGIGAIGVAAVTQGAPWFTPLVMVGVLVAVGYLQERSIRKDAEKMGWTK